MAARGSEINEGLRVQPGVAALADEFVVIQFGISAIDAVNLFFLAGTESLTRIEAPNAFEQALAAQHFVQTGDTSREIVGCVEEGRVAIGDLHAFFQQ